MQNYTIQQIVSIIGAKINKPAPSQSIEYLLTDSRKLTENSGTLFFALQSRRDGHSFIPELYKKGVRFFVVSQAMDHLPEAYFLMVENPLKALQQLAAHHREQFHYPVIGITGSNGKTLVKEWLYQLLSPDFNIIRSPKSYNSQIGVPLSVWQMNENYNLAIFEAGISEKGEMESLEKIIRPDIGILTNIGSAHDEGFHSAEEKKEEKLKLFAHCEQLIYSPDYTGILTKKRSINWSVSGDADLQLISIQKEKEGQRLQLEFQKKAFSFFIPFSDAASVENSMSCCALMLMFNYPLSVIAERMQLLAPLAMRLELKKGIQNCSIINDSYSSDLNALHIALDFLRQQHQHPTKTIILSDMLQGNENAQDLYTRIAAMVAGSGVNRMIGIGKQITSFASLFPMEKIFFDTTNDFITHFNSIHFSDETILIKGARAFEFERIIQLFEEQVHETVLEINLNAMVHNLNFFRSGLRKETKIMAMVKAFSYGSGSFEIANLLQFHRVDYLAVAYADEGIALRQAGIKLPLMVMSPEVNSFDAIIEQALEPEIYSFHILQSFLECLKKRKNNQSIKSPFPIHIKLDTGMKRLGFEEEEINELIHILKTHPEVKVQSIFSHLAASDEKDHDAFTRLQIEKFTRICQRIESGLAYSFYRHIANTAAIIRFPEAEFDMVRLGIGLYGIETTEEKTGHFLQQAGTLKTTISQIKRVKKGESIGYGRKGRAEKDIVIATVKIGYADGYSRTFGNGNAYMLINGQSAKTVGQICMDMCMLDVTDIDFQESDEVIVFAEKPSIKDLAKWADTIPYEILTNISQRVKRVYYHD